MYLQYVGKKKGADLYGYCISTYPTEKGDKAVMAFHNGFIISIQDKGYSVLTVIVSNAFSEHYKIYHLSLYGKMSACYMWEQLCRYYAEVEER